MSIEIKVMPNIPPMKWVEFLCQPKYAIALDGFVSGGPRFTKNGPYASFNHHEDVDRLATRATCAQALMAVRQGLFDTFRNEGAPTADIYVNDCDEDVCTSWALLHNQHLVHTAENPAWNRLVAMEDALDATAGAYPFNKDLPALREMAWIFEPYRQFRLSGQLDKKSPSAFKSVITDVEHRILAHVCGRGKEVPLDTRYEMLGGGPKWHLVKEIGAQARTGMFSDGVRIFVSVRERGEGVYTYTIGKMSPFVSIDLEILTNELNSTEGTCNVADCWGGGDTIMGSPRVAGSKLSIKAITELVNRACV